jgi:hypothetical protein
MTHWSVARQWDPYCAGGRALAFRLVTQHATRGLAAGSSRVDHGGCRATGFPPLGAPSWDAARRSFWSRDSAALHVVQHRARLCVPRWSNGTVFQTALTGARQRRRSNNKKRAEIRGFDER